MERNAAHNHLRQFHSTDRFGAGEYAGGRRRRQHFGDETRRNRIQFGSLSPSIHPATLPLLRPTRFRFLLARAARISRATTDRQRSAGLDGIGRLRNRARIAAGMCTSPMASAGFEEWMPAGIITTIAGGGTRSPADRPPRDERRRSLRTSVVVGQQRQPVLHASHCFPDRSYRASSMQFPTSGINFAGGLATDSAGNLYYQRFGNWQTLGPEGHSRGRGDHGRRHRFRRVIRATMARRSPPSSMARRAWRWTVPAMFISPTTANHRIRKVDRNGIITTVAGNGKADYLGDGRAATSASTEWPRRPCTG